MLRAAPQGEVDSCCVVRRDSGRPNLVVLTFPGGDWNSRLHGDFSPEAGESVLQAKDPTATKLGSRVRIPFLAPVIIASSR